VGEAVRLDTKNAPAHYLLGRIYQRTGKPDLAAQQFKLTDELMRSQGENSGGMGMAPRRILNSFCNRCVNPSDAEVAQLLARRLEEFLPA